MVRFDHIMKRLLLMILVVFITCCSALKALTVLHLGNTSAMPRPAATSASPALRARQGRGRGAGGVKAQPPKGPTKHAKAHGSTNVDKASLPMWSDKDDPPGCTTCLQKFGSNDKDALPKQVPLKWRIFNVKSCDLKVIIGLCPVFEGLNAHAAP